MMIIIIMEQQLCRVLDNINKTIININITHLLRLSIYDKNPYYYSCMAENIQDIYKLTRITSVIPIYFLYTVFRQFCIPIVTFFSSITV